jgi:hypothetical protein
MLGGWNLIEEQEDKVQAGVEDESRFDVIEHRSLQWLIAGPHCYDPYTEGKINQVQSRRVDHSNKENQEHGQYITCPFGCFNEGGMNRRFSLISEINPLILKI